MRNPFYEYGTALLREEKNYRIPARRNRFTGSLDHLLLNFWSPLVSQEDYHFQPESQARSWDEIVYERGLIVIHSRYGVASFEGKRNRFLRTLHLPRDEKGKSWYRFRSKGRYSFRPHDIQPGSLHP